MKNSLFLALSSAGEDAVMQTDRRPCARQQGGRR